jgi:hypothetical protein
LGGGNQRPQFGVARPMKSGPGAASAKTPVDIDGGDQFPPIDELDESPEAVAPEAPSGGGGQQLGAMDRLTARQNGSGEAASSKQEGFEASVHKIKEQVLPRLLERVDPEAAAPERQRRLASTQSPIISHRATERTRTKKRPKDDPILVVEGESVKGLVPVDVRLHGPNGWGLGEYMYGYLFGLAAQPGAQEVMTTRGVALSVLYRLHLTLWSLLGGLFVLFEKDRVTKADIDREAQLEAEEDRGGAVDPAAPTR